MTSTLASICQADLLSPLPIHEDVKEELTSAAAVLAAANQIGAVLKNDIKLAKHYLMTVMLNQWLLGFWFDMMEQGLTHKQGFATAQQCPPLSEMLATLIQAPGRHLAGPKYASVTSDVVPSSRLVPSEPTLIEIRRGDPIGPPGILIAEVFEKGKIYDNGLIPHIGPEIEFEESQLCIAFLAQEKREPFIFTSKIGMTVADYQDIGPLEFKWAKAAANAS
jgi:hypothetical protein